ncbi:MAG: hypothetical protein ACPGEF_05410, partial [Endozoicomonas sp.]
KSNGGQQLLGRTKSFSKSDLTNALKPLHSSIKHHSEPAINKCSEIITTPLNLEQNPFLKADNIQLKCPTPKLEIVATSISVAVYSFPL